MPSPGPREPAHPLLTEDDVVDEVCRHLARHGWDVYARATTRQRGPDIAATHRDGSHLLVEAKGRTSARPNSARYGQPFDSAQVRVHVAEAFYTAAAAAEVSGSRRFAALALPDDELHRRYVHPVRSAMVKLAVGIFWVAGSQAVTFEGCSWAP